MRVVVVDRRRGGFHEGQAASNAVSRAWDQEQRQGWQPVTDAVHEVGGTIVAQLWHTGRASHPSLQPGGKEQVGPSAIAIDGSTFARDGRTPT
ncbi:hypothetical protein ABZ512_20970 [Nocardiopsis dassonvillei]|uniref:oxidoreductase n=1 Tax=Nocardiopsis dassonvillei TaxID=2014 RepID=UPI0033EB723C